jgi:hypothetical protein
MNASGGEPVVEVLEVGEEILEKVREVARRIEQRVWRAIDQQSLTVPQTPCGTEQASGA